MAHCSKSFVIDDVRLDFQWTSKKVQDSVRIKKKNQAIVNELKLNFSWDDGGGGQHVSSLQI